MFDLQFGSLTVRQLAPLADSSDRRDLWVVGRASADQWLVWYASADPQDLWVSERLADPTEQALVERLIILLGVEWERVIADPLGQYEIQSEMLHAWEGSAQEWVRSQSIPDLLALRERAQGAPLRDPSIASN